MTRFVQRYRSDPRFYLVYRYKDMRARVGGKTAGDGKSRLWLGLELADRQEFLDWAVNDPSFQKCWNEWLASGYKGRGPTAHRIDREVGYLISNIEYLPHAEKSRKHLKHGKKSATA